MQNISEFIETELKLIPDEEISALSDKLKSLFIKKNTINSLEKIESTLLFQALTHKSFTHENKKIETNNERLEFLGDSVLQLYITNALMNEHKNLSEGKLSKLRSSLVNEGSLKNFALYLKIEEFLLVGKGERKEEGYRKTSLLADCFEAIIGALFQSGGLKASNAFLDELFQLPKFENLFNLSELEHFDYKTNLQELVMKKYKLIPTYRVDEKEENKQKIFAISVWIGEKELSSLESISKKKGMQELAKKVIDNKLYEEVNNVT